MSFTKEEALKIAHAEFSTWGGCKTTVENVAHQVYDACQKAFEEERIDLRGDIEFVERQRDNNAEAGKKHFRELKIANSIVAQQNEQIVELREKIELLKSDVEYFRAYGGPIKQPSFPPPGAPDPGEGYRLLDPEKDDPMSGDEASGKWRPLAEERWRPIQSMRFNPACWYRRNIAAPVEPVVSGNDGWWNCQTHGRTGMQCTCGAATNFVQSSEPDPLEALLPHVQQYDQHAMVKVLCIFIERELARTRKEQK